MKQLLVHCEQDETQVALLDDGQLVEFYAGRPKEEQVGSIFKGKVVNVLPGMQAAFVDIGQQRNAFLYVDDVLPANLEKQPAVKPSIHTLVREGQEIVVQIVKESSGTKGAKITTHYSLPGRWVVLMPEADYVGVSRKIESVEERQRLKELGEQLRLQPEGVIIRTVAAGATREELLKDLNDLRELWASIRDKSTAVSAPAILFRDLDMVPRLIRDLFTEQVDQLVTNHDGKLEDIRTLVRRYAPHLLNRIERYHQPVSMIHYYGIHDALDKLFKPKVWLDNGGYLIFDHTEALTVIDVNTGKYTGSIDLEQTVYDTNMKAAETIARLLRLRDIGGIIIVDFIDMLKDEHRMDVMALKDSRLKEDRTKTVLVGWTSLGLLEITRKKMRSYGDRIQYEICSSCGGTGKRYVTKNK